LNCEEARLLVHALVDGELDSGHAREVEAHVASCAECAAELALMRDLRDKMKSVDLHYPMPDGLLNRLERTLPVQPIAKNSPGTRRDLLKGFGAGVGLSAIAASGLLVMVVRKDAEDQMLGSLVSAHLRSLQADHLTDVQTSDQHMVKPWFNGRVDVAPPVPDLTAQGFTLVGGRLDTVEGNAVAAIVYRRRGHVINLFVAVAATDKGQANMEIVRGFNIRHWSDQGLSLWAVSDINAAELEEFEQKFENAIHDKTSDRPKN
jgi:anti-sigma factor RsiW